MMSWTRATCAVVLAVTLLKPSPGLGQADRQFSSGERAGWTKLFQDMKDDNEDGSACYDVAETALGALNVTQQGSQYDGDIFVWRWNKHIVLPNGNVAYGYHDADNAVPGYPGMHWIGIMANKLEFVSPSGDSTWVARTKIEIYWSIVHETRHHSGYGEAAVDSWVDNVAANCDVPEQEIPEAPSGGGGSDDPPPPVDEEEEEEEGGNEVEVTIKCSINCTG